MLPTLIAIIVFSQVDINTDNPGTTLDVTVRTVMINNTTKTFYSLIQIGKVVKRSAEIFNSTLIGNSEVPSSSGFNSIVNLDSFPFASHTVGGAFEIYNLSSSRLLVVLARAYIFQLEAYIFFMKLRFSRYWSEIWCW